MVIQPTIIMVCYKTAGGYSNLVLNTDWNISTDSSAGYPAIT